MRLEGKVAIVTGGASGIGYGTAKRFLQEGAKVAICDVRQEAINAAVESLKEFGPVAGYVTDISDRAQCDEMAKAVADSEALRENTKNELKDEFDKIKDLRFSTLQAMTQYKDKLDAISKRLGADE